jgi:hypothetical protein
MKTTAREMYATGVAGAAFSSQPEGPANVVPEFSLCTSVVGFSLRL